MSFSFPLRETVKNLSLFKTQTQQNNKQEIKKSILQKLMPKESLPAHLHTVLNSNFRSKTHLSSERVFQRCRWQSPTGEPGPLWTHKDDINHFPRLPSVRGIHAVSERPSIKTVRSLTHQAQSKEQVTTGGQGSRHSPLWAPEGRRTASWKTRKAFQKR